MTDNVLANWPPAATLEAIATGETHGSKSNAGTRYGNQPMVSQPHRQAEDQGQWLSIIGSYGTPDASGEHIAVHVDAGTDAGIPTDYWWLTAANYSIGKPISRLKSTRPNLTFSTLVVCLHYERQQSTGILDTPAGKVQAACHDRRRSRLSAFGIKPGRQPGCGRHFHRIRYHVNFHCYLVKGFGPPRIGTSLICPQGYPRRSEQRRP